MTGTVPLADILAEFSSEDRAEIKERSREIVQTSRSIRQLRRDMGLTQAQLAEALAVSQAYVAKAERGVAGDMQVATIAKIVAAMGGEVKVMVSLPNRPDTMLHVAGVQPRVARGARTPRVSRPAS